MYEELSQMERRPEKLCDMIKAVVTAGSSEFLKQKLTSLLKETICVFDKIKEELGVTQKVPVAAGSICGTYEEMYSNWKNKMQVAAKENNKHLAFSSMSSLNEMLSDIGKDVAIDKYEVFEHYNPQDLQQTATGYDKVLKMYLKEYEKAELQAKHYPDVDAFVKDYLQGI